MSYDLFGFIQKMATLFEGEEHARLYSRYRPEYPIGLYNRIIEYLAADAQKKSKTLAVDVGCGSGQYTRVLAPYFDEVVGVDTSKAQLEEARKYCSGLANVSFRHGSANDMSEFLKDGSVDLVSVATALHWFDLEAFFGECLRILRPGGVLAAFSYSHIHVDDPKADQAIRQLTEVTLCPYWAPQTRLAWNNYQEVFPVLQKFFPKSERDDSFEIKFTFSIKEICGFISTFSPYQTYRKQNPTSLDPLVETAKELEVIYGTPSEGQKVVNGYMNVFLLLGKKP